METGSPTPARLDPGLVDVLRLRLEGEREELLAQASGLEADFAHESWKEPRSDDDAEAGTATAERERTMSLARHARAAVVQIEQALARMGAGTYGRCITCGQPIAAERLEALPAASECLDCRRKAERSR